MTPRERAIELLIKMGYIEGALMAVNYIAKRHALIAVDEILDALDKSLIDADIEWFKQVKEEIEKL